MMSPELTALRDEAMTLSCEAWAIQKRWVLSPGIDRSGPCPVCGGKDRFSIHTVQNIYNCRRCAISGSGVIRLVMDTEKVDFVTACEIITGRKASDPLDEARAAEARRKVEEDDRRRRAQAESYREQARRDAYELWRRRVLFSTEEAEPVRRYHALRAIELTTAGADFDLVVGFIDQMPWTEQYKDERDNDAWRTLEIAPAQLLAITRPDGKFGGTHITWLDLGQPKGKLVLPDDEKGKPRPSKKVRGTKKGGAIRLFTPPTPRRIVMGEGFETTATAFCHAFERDTAYWAGVDLGNMSGRALYVNRKPVHHQPDMEDRECFLPPDWCEELVYLGEADEAAVHSREKCIRGLLRARRLRQQRIDAGEALSPLSIIYVPIAGEAGGGDLNDLAMMDMATTDGVAAD